MQKYRKKPVIVEAVQWLDTDEQYKELRAAGIIEKWNPSHGEHDTVISTLEGDMRCSCLDYIIKGVKGEYYPCKPDIFEATYEPVD